MPSLSWRRPTAPNGSQAHRVVLALHAHPDDESLLTGGTLATMAGAGHRVVVVVATDGDRGLTGADAGDLGQVRADELDRAARALGVTRVVRLGYADSGMSGTAPGGFCSVPVAEVAARVARLIADEGADVLIGYDRFGGYGHPDHVHVHAVAEAVAATTGVRLVHATVDRTWLRRGMTLAARCHVLPAGVSPDAALRWYSDRTEITHRISVRRVSAAKRRALRCHASQRSGGGGAPRTVQLLSRLPLPVFALVAGTEWFVEAHGHAGRRPVRDLLVAAEPAAA